MSPSLPHPPSHGTECGCAGCILGLIKEDCRVEMTERWDRRSWGLRLWGASVSAQLMVSLWAVFQQLSLILMKVAMKVAMDVGWWCLIGEAAPFLWEGVKAGVCLSIAALRGLPNILVQICAPGPFLHSMMTVFPSKFSTSEPPLSLTQHSTCRQERVTFLSEHKFWAAF